VKVAINGAGIAGPTLAYWLKRDGHEPVIFERAPALRTGGYMIDFWGLGYDVAERMGLTPRVRDAGYLMERLRMVDADGQTDAELDVRPVREQLRGRFVSVARSALSEAIIDACGDSEIHFGRSITGLDDDGQGVTATLSDGTTERFDLVVGADGVHSQVRRLIAGPDSQYERSLGCHVAAFRLPSYPNRDELTYVSHTLPGRQVARVGLRDDATLVLLICLDEAMPETPATADAVKPALRRTFGDMQWEVPEILDRMEQVDDVYFDAVSQIHLPQWSRGRTALVGDAAACVSFLAGEGTGLAMVEAYVLAGELKTTPDDIPGALQRYEAQLRRFIEGKQRSATQFRGFFAPKSALGLKFRDLAVAAFGLPLVGSTLMRLALKDDFDLPN
jgi:2-polyprenyl-6-methoxyphenol hydroxylase-like FAD-dependent oxidoreductase